MGCGKSSIQQNQTNPSEETSTQIGLTDLVGSYRLETEKRGSFEVHLLIDGRILFDGNFALSVVFRHGNRELTFTLPKGSDISSGHLSIAPGGEIGGTFTFVDGTTAPATVTKDDSLQPPSDLDGRGNPSVVINDNTLQRYKELEKRVEKFQQHEVSNDIDMLTKKAESLEIRIRDKVKEVDNLKQNLVEMRSQPGFDEDKAKEIELEIESKCLSLAADQREYEETLKYLGDHAANLFDYNIAVQEFDDILNAMFGGEGGSEIENQLEALVMEAEESLRAHLLQFEAQIWETAKSLSLLVLQALNTWSTLSRAEELGPERSGSLVQQTHSLLEQLIEGIVEMEEFLLTKDESYVCETAARNSLIQFRNNLFKVNRDVEGGVTVLMEAKEAVNRIENWVYKNFQIKESEERKSQLTDELRGAKVKLKMERQGLIQDWLMDHVGYIERPERTNTTLTNGTPPSSVSKEDECEPRELSYTEIVNGLKEREKHSELDDLRAKLELQTKIQQRRRRQRHKNAQKIIEVQAD